AAIRIAFRAIARSKLRATLTILGILIGVMAVVVVVALGTSMRDAITRRFSTLGTTTIFIWPEATQTSGARQKNMGRLTEPDGEPPPKEPPSISMVVPFAASGARVVLGDRNWPTTAMGTIRPYIDIRTFKIEKGAMWTETDEQLKAKVVVLG